MSYDRFGNQISSELSPPSDMNNPVKFENNYENSYETNLDNTYDSNLPDSSNNSAIVNSEPRKSVSERRTAEFDTETALKEHDKIEFGQIPSVFCNFCQCGNSFMDMVCNKIFSTKWIAILLIIADAGLHIWATTLHSRCSSAYSRSWIGILERYTIGLEWYFCLSGIYGILNTNRTLICQYFLFSCFEFGFGLFVQIWSLRRFKIFMNKTIDTYGSLEAFNTVYERHREEYGYMYTDHETCYPVITEALYANRVFLAIVFLSLNLFNNYVMGRYYLWLRYKKRIIKSKSRFDHPSLKEEKLCKNCWPSCAPHCCDTSCCDNVEGKCLGVLK